MRLSCPANLPTILETDPIRATDQSHSPERQFLVFGAHNRILKRLFIHAGARGVGDEVVGAVGEDERVRSSARIRLFVEGDGLEEFAVADVAPLVFTNSVYSVTNKGKEFLLLGNRILSRTHRAYWIRDDLDVEDDHFQN
jgi:hypothetical protein